MAREAVYTGQIIASVTIDVFCLQSHQTSRVRTLDKMRTDVDRAPIVCKGIDGSSLRQDFPTVSRAPRLGWNLGWVSVRYPRFHAMFEAESILGAVIILIPVLWLSYRDQVKLKVQLLEAEKKRVTLWGYVAISVEMLRHPDGHDDPVGDVLNILNDALGREDGDYGDDECTDWTARAAGIQDGEQS